MTSTLEKQTLVTPEVFEEVCMRIAAGESLRGVCSDEGMPAAPTVLRHIARNEAAGERYARAIQQRALTKAEEIEALMAEVKAGVIAPDAARVLLDGHKWISSRLLPKVYGEKQEVKHEVQHTHTLHLDALKQLADEVKRKRDAQVIDVTPVPALDVKVLDAPAPLLANPIPISETDSDAGHPPSPPPPGGGSVAGTTSISTKKIRTPKKLK